MADRDLTIERLDREVRALAERVAVLESARPVSHSRECRIRSAMADHWQCNCSGVLALYSNFDEPVEPGMYERASERARADALAGKPPPEMAEPFAVDIRRVLSVSESVSGSVSATAPAPTVAEGAP